MILLVDATYLLTRLSKSKKYVQHNREVYIPLVFFETLWFIKNLYHCYKIIIAHDGHQSGLYKTIVQKTYKFNRLQKSLITQKTEEEIINEENPDNIDYYYEVKYYKHIKENVKELCDILGIPFLELPYIEADDIISYYVKTYPDEDKLIFSNDQDFLQFIDEKTSLLLYDKLTEKVTIHNFAQIYGFPPQNIRIVKSIIGDKTDNIKNVPGIQKTTLLDNFPQLKTQKFETLEEFINLVMHTDCKIKNKLLQHIKIIKNNYLLLSYDEITLDKKQLQEQLQRQLQTKEKSLTRLQQVLMTKYAKYIDNIDNIVKKFYML